MCDKQYELQMKVQDALIRLSDLAHLEADAISDRSSGIWIEIDKQIENQLGEKERAIGALKEHQREHGC